MLQQQQPNQNDFKDSMFMTNSGAASIMNQSLTPPLLSQPPPSSSSMYTENEREQMEVRLSQLQQENQMLRTQLNDLNSKNNVNKDNETQHLKRLVEELVKSNEEKDKKLDELTKQVIRFKRIQEIVLSAQVGGNQSLNSKTRNINDFDFDLDNNNVGNKINDSNDSQQQQISNQKLISSCSLSSSLSSSSSSTSTSSIAANNNNNNHSSNQNSNSQLTNAPLATISEICSYTTDKTLNTINNNNNNTSDETLDGIQFSLIDQQKIENIKQQSLSYNSKVETTNMQRSIITKKGSICSLNNKNQKASSEAPENKYSSTSSINHRLLSSLLLNSTGKQQSSVSKNKFFTQKHNSINTGTKGLRNFFGKLMRNSLMNINDAPAAATNNRNSGNQSDDCFEPADSDLVLVNGQSLKTDLIASFKRGGFRSTAGARLQTNNVSKSAVSSPSHHSTSNSFSELNHHLRMQQQLQLKDMNVDTFTFAEWPGERVYEWLRTSGFEAYFPVTVDGVCINKWIKSGLHLLQASQFEFEKELGIKNPLHRKRLTLLLQSLYNSSLSMNSPENYNMSLIDSQWVTKWLDDIGLPQYKDVFHECMIDGLMLHHLSNEDFQLLNIHSELHFLSIKRAIHVLRLNNFDPQCLRRRPSGDDILDKSEVMLWTNHRVMEWLRSIDLSEYAPNLRGSGVHGGLMVFETRFNSTVLADILSIPASKTLLRRHLNSLFIDLIGPTMHKLKKEAESQPGYQLLNASSKVKHSKRIAGIFSNHKRTKSQDSREFLSGPILILNQPSNKQSIAESSSSKTLQQKISNHSKVCANHSATLPINTVNFSETTSTLIGFNSTSTSFNNESSNFKVKLSILSSQENVPTSIV